MSTIVCQNLVTGFESPETTTTLKLKLSPPPPSDFNWGFLPIKEYYNKSFSRLSEKSLQLCTENLGSETGTDIISDDDNIFFAPSPPHSPGGGHKQKSPEKPRRSFPPPLTTMSGSSSLQVRRHREEGRLIIEAVEAPFRNSYLQAERSDGRLRLCFMAPAETASISGEEEDEEEVVDGGECGGETAAEEEEVDEAVTTELISSEKEEMNLEMEKEKYQRLSRCKESGHGSKGLCSSWKPALWVATS